MALTSRGSRWGKVLVRLCLVGALLALPTIGWPLDPDVLPSQYRHRAWGVAEGLPQSTVMAVARDHRGYLWVGTQAGMARFDGSQFTVFDELTTPSLPAPVVLSLAADHDRLWIGTTEGLYLMEGQQVERIDLPGTGPGERCTVVEPGSRGGILAATSLGRVYRVEDRDAALLSELPLPAQRPGVQALLEGRGGRVWVGTESGLWSIGPNGPAPVLWTGRSGPAWTVFDLLSDSGGTVLAATEGGLFALDPGRSPPAQRRIELPGRGEAMVRCLERDGDGNLWVGTMGAGVYRRSGGRCTRMAPGRLPGLASVRCLLVDDEGILWMGSFEGGLHRLVDSGFLNFREAEGLAGGPVRTLALSRRGGLWVGSAEGLSKISGGSVHRLPWISGRLQNGVMSVLEASDGTVWIGTDGDGVLRIRGRRVESWGRERHLPHGVAAVLFEDASGTLWAGTDGGVARRDGDRWRAYSVAEGLPNNVVTSIAQALDGAIVAGTMGGLARLEGSRFVTWPDGGPKGPVSTLWFDPDGDLWLAVEGRGITLVDSTGTHTLDRRNGFSLRTVGQMGLGRDGTLWLAGMQGLSAVPWKELKRHLEGRGPRPVFRSFTARDGLASTECSTGTQPALAVDAGGSVWVATVAGVSCLPGGVAPRRPAVRGPVVIEQVQVDGTKVPVDRAAEFAAGIRSVELRFTSLSFLMAEEPRYSTWLEGLEDGWQDVGGNHRASYTHLPAGRFVFHVRTLTSDGAPVHDEARFVFTVLPPVWRRPWFLVLLGFVFLAAGPGIYFYRVTTLKRRQRQLSALVDERTAELQETAAALEQMTLEDPLTGIPNYRAFGRELERAWREAHRQGRQVAVVMSDIDFFKAFNDAFGHLHGDECLRRVAAALSSCARRPGDLVARYGGEEFVTLLPATGTAGAVRLAEEMRRAVEALQIECPRPDGVSVVTMSFGVASARPSERRGGSSLVAAADRALYRAKDSGRNRVEAASDGEDHPTDAYPVATGGEQTGGD